ncbi:MAG: peroxiredoxin family protein [Salibacteraceae bacterium]
MNFPESPSFNAKIDPNRELPHASPEDGQLIAELKSKQVNAGALRVGDKAPNFASKDGWNQSHTLSSLLLNHKAIVVNFYRGMWCPFCNIELRRLQQSLKEFESNRVGIVAISPQSPDNSLATMEKHNLDFVVLSDVKNEVAKQFGISFPVPSYLLDVYAGFG